MWEIISGIIWTKYRSQCEESLVRGIPTHGGGGELDGL